MKQENITSWGPSIDQNKTLWLLSENIRAKYIILLRVVKNEKFQKTYLMKCIPNFPIINPYDKIANPKMPAPCTSDLRNDDWFG